MEKLWFYASPEGSSKVGPIPQNELQRLIAQGVVTREYLVWTDGMADWRKLGEVPSLSPEPAASVAGHPPTATPVRSLSVAIPSGLGGWMTFVGVMHIVLGILSVLSCVGLINGVLMIVGGIALLGARSALLPAPSESSDWSTFFSKLHTFILMNGIQYILLLVMLVLYIALLMPMLNSIFSEMLKN